MEHELLVLHLSVMEVVLSRLPNQWILVLFAAVRSNPTLISSEMSFTVVPGSVSSNIAWFIIDTWAPVSQRADTSESFKRQLTVHFLPTRLTILACCVGVRWLRNAVSVDLGFSPSVSTFIAWHIFLWFGHWEQRLQFSSGAPVARAAKRSPIPIYSGERKETHELIFSCYRDQQYFSWARTHYDGGDGGVAQRGGHSPNRRLIETCSVYLVLFLIYDIMLWSIDTCQIKLSADQYHETISRTQVYSSSRWRVLLKLTADQGLDFWLDRGLMSSWLVENRARLLGSLLTLIQVWK